MLYLSATQYVEANKVLWVLCYISVQLNM